MSAQAVGPREAHRGFADAPTRHIRGATGNGALRAAKDAGDALHGLLIGLAASGRVTEVRGVRLPLRCK